MKIAHIKISGGQNDVVIACGETVVTEDSSTAVTLEQTMPHVPVVTVTPLSNDSGHNASVDSISTSGFTIYMNKTGGGAAGDITVEWVAVC